MSKNADPLSQLESLDIPEGNDINDPGTDQYDGEGGGVYFIGSWRKDDDDTDQYDGEGGGVYLIGGEPVHQFTLAVITHALHEKHHFPFLSPR